MDLIISERDDGTAHIESASRAWAIEQGIPIYDSYEAADAAAEQQYRFVMLSLQELPAQYAGQWEVQTGIYFTNDESMSQSFSFHDVRSIRCASVADAHARARKEIRRGHGY